MLHMISCGETHSYGLSQVGVGKTLKGTWAIAMDGCRI